MHHSENEEQHSIHNHSASTEDSLPQTHEEGEVDRASAKNCVPSTENQPPSDQSISSSKNQEKAAVNKLDEEHLAGKRIPSLFRELTKRQVSPPSSRERKSKIRATHSPPRKPEQNELSKQGPIYPAEPSPVTTLEKKSSQEPIRRSRLYAITDSLQKQLPTWLIATIPFIFALLGILVVSGYVGRNAGVNDNNVVKTSQANYIQEQYDLALADVHDGRFELASQRLEFILQYDPENHKAANSLAEVLGVINATATPTPLPPTVTPTPTRDARPLEELFIQAKALTVDEKWTEAIETLLSLRKAEPNFRYVEIDNLLYLSLRNRGVVKIIDLGDLEGGLYDFTLAEQYGPLDALATNYQEWARIYLIGNSFWVQVGPHFTATGFL
jgi:hypothetical protein